MKDILPCATSMSAPKKRTDWNLGDGAGLRTFAGAGAEAVIAVAIYGAKDIRNWRADTEAERDV